MGLLVRLVIWPIQTIKEIAPALVAMACQLPSFMMQSALAGAAISLFLHLLLQLQTVALIADADFCPFLLAYFLHTCFNPDTTVMQHDMTVEA